MKEREAMVSTKRSKRDIAAVGETHSYTRKRNGRVEPLHKDEK